MLEPPKFIDNDLYGGSRTFTWLADMVGLSVDLVSNTICIQRFPCSCTSPTPLLRNGRVHVCVLCIYWCLCECQSYEQKAAVEISKNPGESGFPSGKIKTKDEHPHLLCAKIVLYLPGNGCGEEFSAGCPK